MHKRNLYNVLIKPIYSEKSMTVVDKYAFKVVKEADKGSIKKAVEKLLGAQVKSVNVMNVPGKTKFSKGRKGFRIGYKKAIVTLKEGQKIESIERV